MGSLLSVPQLKAGLWGTALLSMFSSRFLTWRPGTACMLHVPWTRSGHVSRPKQVKEWPVHMDFSSKPIIRNISDLPHPSKRPCSVWDTPASHPDPWTEFKKRCLFHSLLNINIYIFFFGFLCVPEHSNTRLFPEHSSFVYLSIPITDLRLSACSDGTFPRDHSLCYNASFRVLVLKPPVLCKVTELPHWALTLGVLKLSLA